MCTARLLPVSPSMHCSWGEGGVPVGGVPAREVYPPGGVPARGYLPGGVYLLGGTCSGTPPYGQNDRQVQKYYLALNFVCGGNYSLSHK